ncbi:MAG: hypothetical protein WBF71_01585 [Microthrixaceae bacterium]
MAGVNESMAGPGLLALGCAVVGDVGDVVGPSEWAPEESDGEEVDPGTAEVVVPGVLAVVGPHGM